MVKPAVRIHELKNKLIILGHELKVNKKLMIPYIEKYNINLFKNNWTKIKR